MVIVGHGGLREHLPEESRRVTGRRMVASDPEQDVGGTRARLQVATRGGEREVIGPGRQLDSHDQKVVGRLESRAQGDVPETDDLAAGGGGGDGPVDARGDQIPVQAAKTGLDRGRDVAVLGGEVSVGPVVAFVLIDGVETHVQGVGAGHGSGAVGEIVDADAHAAAGAGGGVGSEKPQAEGAEKEGATDSRERGREGFHGLGMTADVSTGGAAKPPMDASEPVGARF